MERSGQIIRLKKGLYILPEKENGLMPQPELVANHLHTHTSYVSMQTALRYYGLIPEHVYTIKSMTLGRSCEFDNALGRFIFFHACSDYYAIGITCRQSGSTFFQIATPEKALCDLIVTTSGLQLRSRAAVTDYLEQFLRLDMDAFRIFDASIFENCAEVGMKSQTLYNISKVLRRCPYMNFTAHGEIV